MSAMAETDRLFFARPGLDAGRVRGLVAAALAGCDDGELYLAYERSESLVFDDGRLKSASFDTTQGFGLRAVAEDRVAYAHANLLDADAIARAGDSVRAVRQGYAGSLALPPGASGPALYAADDPVAAIPFVDKVTLLADIDAYARGRDPRVRQVTASLHGVWQAVRIMRADVEDVADLRPLVRLNVQVVVAQGDRMESAGDGAGGRVAFDRFMDPAQWRAQVDEALRQALVKLDSVPAPAGEMTVVLGPGWPGVLLHEAVGHGLEGDFNRKGTSAFAGLVGQRVASPGVTVVDDGTIGDRRGSLTIDDEGTPTGRTVLIEDGILKGFLQDRMNARLMGKAATGNGRRQSYAHMPMPRMTNTFMLAGKHAPDEIVASVKKGLYAATFGGGQVDITSGKFVFDASEAYLIEDGRIGAPVKGATLIGNGPDALTRIAMIGDDLKLDAGIGTCGKDGQSVPVGVGLPTIRLDAITVGGTAA
jgi:TldD protein